MTHHLTPHVEGPRSELRDQLAQLSDEQRSRLMQRLRSRTSPEWFIRSGPTAPAVRLFCFSYAGGGTSVFRGWRDHLPEGVEVCATQLPGRETRAGEVAYRRMEPLITDLETAITPLLESALHPVRPQHGRPRLLRTDPPTPAAQRTTP